MRQPHRSFWGSERRKPRHSQDTAKGFSHGTLLAAILVLMVYFWIHRHFNEQLKWYLKAGSGAVIATLLAAAAGAHGLFKTQVEDLVKGIQRSLSTRGAPKFLGAGMIMMAILLVVTSSVRVTLEGAGASASVEFEIRKDGRVLEKDFVLSRDGRPYFHMFWFSLPGEVSLKLLKPAGYLAERRFVGPLSAVVIKAPGDFRPKQTHVLRLVPAWGLLELLDPASRTTDNTCRRQPGSPSRFLKIEVRRAKLKPESYCVPLGLNAIYIGASKPELETIVLGEAAGEWVRQLRAEISPLNMEANAQLQELAASTPL
ncbi:MAG TPA: hypothetical protein VMW27_05475, partial [Thermoanaerobaculia bacterium]|nr:hypothetical protein [Thermoanaerobaculia bacterium]